MLKLIRNKIFMWKLKKYLLKNRLTLGDIPADIDLFNLIKE